MCEDGFFSKSQIILLGNCLVNAFRSSILNPAQTNHTKITHSKRSVISCGKLKFFTIDVDHLMLRHNYISIRCQLLFKSLFIHYCSSGTAILIQRISPFYLHTDIERCKKMMIRPHHYSFNLYLDP